MPQARVWKIGPSEGEYYTVDLEGSIQELLPSLKTGEKIFLCGCIATEWQVCDEGVITIMNGQVFQNGVSIPWQPLVVSEECAEYNRPYTSHPYVHYLLPRRIFGNWRGSKFGKIFWAYHGSRCLCLEGNLLENDVADYKIHPHGIVVRKDDGTFWLIVIKTENQSQGSG